MKIALQVGRQLPAFENAEEAQRVLFARRDLLLSSLRQIIRPGDPFKFDATPKSLKALEGWYFDLLDGDHFAGRHVTKEQFEQMISMYFGQVLVQNCRTCEWSVWEFPFLRGRYAIGVATPFGGVWLGRSELDHRRNNKRRQSLWREYRQYAQSAAR